MTVFNTSSAGFLVGSQVIPVDYESEVSQRLIDAIFYGDSVSVFECIEDPFVDVSFIGIVNLKSKKTEVVLNEESGHEVRVEYEEFKTEVTALFLAAHAGSLILVRKLLSLGANVNQFLFRGYATTAAVREGHLEILQLLIKAGASQKACEEALLEASYLGNAKAAECLMASEIVSSKIAVHALVSASCRGFVDVVDTLVKCGVDANATDRVLLQSSKPSLHANVDCAALAAAVVSRQISVVRLLLQVGVKTDIKVKLGAWSWDTDTGEEFRVGAGLADAYSITWCAVEYFEASGAILQTLLQHISVNTPHYGRTLIHHAILCNNAKAVESLLHYGSDVEHPVRTTLRPELLPPVHLAAKLGFSQVLQCLITTNGCDLDSKTASGETALMVCSMYKREECLKVLASAGADFGLVNDSGHCATSIAGSVNWAIGFQRVVFDVIQSGKIIKSSNAAKFFPLMFVTRFNNVEALKKLMDREGVNLDEQDNDGYSAIMVAAENGYVQAFRLLLYAGASVMLRNKQGETAIRLSESNSRSDLFDKVMLEHVFQKGHEPCAGFFALHCAARHGEINLIKLLTSRSYDINAKDGNGYTPLMLAAKGGHARVCELLIKHGAKCDIENSRQETALFLARKNGYKKSDVESVILDELARVFVLNGTRVKKHTKCGKGTPHRKVLKMVVGPVAGVVLRWGKSSKRNVVCREVEVGPSEKFRWNRRRKFDVEEGGLFHVVTSRNKEVHFVCEGGVEMAQLWVRGIKLLSRDTICVKK